MLVQKMYADFIFILANFAKLNYNIIEGQEKSKIIRVAFSLMEGGFYG